MKKFLSILILPLLLAFGCSNPDDVSPVITAVSVNGTTGDYLIANAGQDNVFNIGLADDKDLKQVKIAIITQSGIHQHETSEGEMPHAMTFYNQGEWDTLRVTNIGGKEALVDNTFMAPDDISGGWKLEIDVLDDNGNLVSKEYLLTVNNAFIPAIGITNTEPAVTEDGLIAISAGQSLILEGQILDTDSLDIVDARLEDSSGEIWSQNWSGLFDWSFDLSQIQIPVLDSIGNYWLHVEATDLEGSSNHGLLKLKVE